MNRLEALELSIEYLEEEQYWLRNALKEIVDYLEDEVGHPRDYKNNCVNGMM